MSSIPARQPFDRELRLRNFMRAAPKLCEKLRELAERIAAREVSGFTFDLLRCAPALYTRSTYFVSRKGYERRFSSPPTYEGLLDYVLFALALLKRPRNYLGFWFDEDSGEFVFDVTVPITGRARAVRYGRKQKQTAIFHPWTGEVISLAGAVAR